MNISDLEIVMTQGEKVLRNIHNREIYPRKQHPPAQYNQPISPLGLDEDTSEQVPL